MYKTIELKSDAHKVLGLPHGELHVFANDEVFYGLEHKVFEMADNNLRIPRSVHMSYTPDAHVGKGTCIGTTAVWSMRDGFVSPSIVGVDIGCGMRVHLTPLHKNDLKDKGVRRKLIEAIEKYVPTNERTNSNYSDIDLESVITSGLNGLHSKYSFAFGRDAYSKVENHVFDFDHKYLKDLPSSIYKRAAGQLGTLGGGEVIVVIATVSVNSR